MSLGHVEELNHEREGSCQGSALIAPRLEGSPWEGAGDTQRGDTSMFPAPAQGSGWKQLQRREVHFPGCRGPVQVVLASRHPSEGTWLLHQWHLR